MTAEPVAYWVQCPDGADFFTTEPTTGPYPVIPLYAIAPAPPGDRQQLADDLRRIADRYDHQLREPTPDTAAMRAAAALLEAAIAPAIPREPSPEMIDAGYAVFAEWDEQNFTRFAQAFYQAMYDAAPTGATGSKDDAIKGSPHDPTGK